MGNEDKQKKQAGESFRKGSKTPKRAQNKLMKELKTVGYEEGKEKVSPGTKNRAGYGAVIDKDGIAGAAGEKTNKAEQPKEEKTSGGVKVKVISVMGAGYDSDEGKYASDKTHWNVIINMGKRHKLKKGTKVNFGLASGKVIRLFATRAMVMVKADEYTAESLKKGTLVK